MILSAGVKNGLQACRLLLPGSTAINVLVPCGGWAGGKVSTLGILQSKQDLGVIAM